MPVSFSELPSDRLKFLDETGIRPEAFEQWLEKERTNIQALSARVEGDPELALSGSRGVIEFLASMKDAKTHRRWVMVTGASGENDGGEGSARKWIGELEQKLGTAIQVSA